MRRVRDMIHADGNRGPVGFQTETRRAAARRCALAVVAFVLAVHADVATVHADDDAVGGAAAGTAIQNGLVSRGAGNLPLGWRSEGWSATAGTTYAWDHTEPGPGALVVRNPKVNDARWTQSVPVQPETWYRI